ncbi:aquaporin [Exiguobacterium sp. KRL4]|uniref:MIP/aquaporin family protein n=1 Tax=Exiguobacterium sp. KRL4 TaxID=1914536 RepID=UPI0008F82CB4|nr:MIP/aquaporin family protein [Exiguobacterium sp. KRL4]OIN68283.1 aquaporin [Exiguobacterium sp. KRL4]
MSNFTSELIGTMILILLGDGVVAGVVLKKTKSENSGWIVITFAWGLAVMTAVYVAAASGAHLNPAVTLSLALNSDLPWADVPVYIAAQLIGAFIGAVLVWLHYMKHFEATDDQAAKLGVFATGPAIRHTGSNLVSEIIGTFVLVFGILAFGANSFADGLNPLIVGLLVVVIGLSLGGTTGYAINPARDLGPRIAHAILPIKGKGSSDWSYSWIPVVGPFIGGAIAVFLHQMLF